jgi:hypothetical protein
MPKIAYQEINFRRASLEMIERVNRIVAAYQAQGFMLTLRQVYYQLVARGIIENTERSYKNVGALVNDGRMAGLIDWHAIEDRTRNVRANSHWTTPEDIIKSAAYSYAIEKWNDQPYRVEVWIEKDALVGVIGGICVELDVPYFSCRGYTSQSEMWTGAMRLKRHIKAGQKPVVLHLGDHDPSGIDMSRDIRERLELFIGRPIEFRRLALNRDQIETYSPPPNPAKITDSRAAEYIAQHGAESWELDALEPAVLERLIRDNVLHFRDAALWSAATDRESREKRELQAAAENWTPIVDYMDEQAWIDRNGGAA